MTKFCGRWVPGAIGFAGSEGAGGRAVREAMTVFRGQCQKQVVNLPDYGGYIRGMCSARTVVRVPCHGWIWADIVARKGRPPLAQVRTLSAAGPHFCPGPATVFGLLCILASPVPNKTTDRRRKSHRPGTMRYQTLLGMSIISKNNRVFALSRDSVASLRHLVRSRGAA